MFLASRNSFCWGNRGSGKSAIFKILAEREKKSGAVVIELSPEDYSYEMLSQVMRKEKEGAWAKLGSYAAAWKYLIYVLIMKGLTEQGPKLKRGAANRIYAYLRDNHSGSQSNPIATMISYLKRIEGFKVGGYEAKLKTQELTRLYRLEEIDRLIPDLRELCDRFKVLVLVDELDRGWDASEDAKGLRGRLVSGCRIDKSSVAESACRHSPAERALRTAFPVCMKMPRSTVTSWRRSSGTNLRFLTWWHSESGTAFPDMKKRVAKLVGMPFSRKHWVTGRPKSFNYMIDRTLYRPREIIQFCIDAVQEATEDKIPEPIDYAVLTGAEFRYSQQRTQDIAAEYRFQYPGLMSIFDVFRGRSIHSLKEFELLLLRTGESRSGKKPGLEPRPR